MDERVRTDERSGVTGASGGRPVPARGSARRLLTLPLLGALLATGAAACSTDNSAALGNWAKQVCDGLRAPVTQSQDAMKDTGLVKDGEAPADLQKRLATDLGNLGTANQSIADAIDKAGAPKVDNGAGLQKDAVNELRQAAQGYQDVQKKLTALPTDDQAKFADGLKSIGDQVQQLSTLSTGALGKVQTGDLGTAIAKQPGCKSQDAGPAAGASGSPGASGSANPAGSPAAGASPSAGASGSPSGSASAAPSSAPSNAPSAPPSTGQSAAPSGSGSGSPAAAGASPG
ncbi:hypothetical protein OG455_21900 [Kitasatospora sp. NBC_01287]|uniref:hypothetical protein n=1 Tax=Kitasatospora sp. NBC_01287 TaxID=2903573 RepID=UPI00225947D0|nr:hypothetical protein [Kitasatospora sp. NBC_01287]MCX4748133.1 hypothetical protein [Kitasatospora sp. NBC_01287]